MSCKELIEALKQTADERIRLLWQEAESEAATARADAGRRLELLRRESDRKRTLLNAELSARAASEGNSRARNARLSAEKLLSGRLYDTAVSLLSGLRGDFYGTLFSLMARELPDLAWQAVRVSPKDAALAKKHFPGAQIIPDASISGGMDVSALDGAVRVVNTFEKRLERAWSRMEPELIRDVYHEVGDEASSADARGPGVPDRISAQQDQREKVTSDL